MTNGKENDGIEVRLVVQRHIVLAYDAADSGAWRFVVCRTGLQQMFEERLKTGQELLVRFRGEILTPKDGDGEDAGCS